MTILDYLIFGAYMLAVLGVGVYYFFRNRHSEDYYVANRSMRASHVGMSIVATDVGGGFSIGLGGVGFAMGLSGSWLLFTGLVGAWLSAVLIVPRIKKIDARHGMMTYPDFLRFRYDGRVALVAALISGVGYLGFTGGQILAGATLAGTTMFTSPPWGLNPITFSLIVIATITILYTVLGGLKAVIYTDTVQWVVLLGGLIFVTIPVTLHRIGGFARLRQELPAEFFTLTNIAPVTFVNWMITIIPIWLIGMTLYQRMYACRDLKSAKRAWYVAGLLEYPVMAFAGVFLGMCARVMFPAVEAEKGLPLLIREVLPAGVTGIVIAAYFSAIMSTADSCMMASSGNFVNDVIEPALRRKPSNKSAIRLSMAVTFIVGAAALLLAAAFNTVLEAIMLAYAFMVSGLFVPTAGAFFWKRGSSAGALAGMLSGGVLTLGMILKLIPIPAAMAAWGLDYSVYGIALSLVTYVAVSLTVPDRPHPVEIETPQAEPDVAEQFEPVLADESAETTAP